MSILRSLCAVTLIALASANLSAQENTRHVQFGVLAGLSLAELTDDFGLVGIKSQRRLGAQAALYMLVPVGNRLALQPELHYVQKGASYTVLNDGDEIPIGAEFKLKLGYFEVPILLRLDLADPASTLRPFLVGGPSAAFRSSCSMEIRSDGFSMSTTCGDMIDNPGSDEDPVKKLDYGVVVGGGFAFRALGVPASIQARYSRGLSTLAREPDADTGKTKNSVIAFLVGLSF